MNVTIELKNPPTGSALWCVAIYSPDDLEMITSLLIPLGTIAIFDSIPISWFPLHTHAVVTEPSPDDLPPILWQKSSRPFHSGYDFYDPSFIISSPGDYYLNITTGQFEAKVLPVATIDAPNSAREGDMVPITATITNSDPEYGYEFKTEVWVGSTLIETFQEIIHANESLTYEASFIMPKSNVTILVWVEHRVGTAWDYVGSVSKEVVISTVLIPGFTEIIGMVVMIGLVLFLPKMLKPAEEKK